MRHDLLASLGLVGLLLVGCASDGGADGDSGGKTGSGASGGTGGTTGGGAGIGSGGKGATGGAGAATGGAGGSTGGTTGGTGGSSGGQTTGGMGGTVANGGVGGGSGGAAPGAGGAGIGGTAGLSAGGTGGAGTGGIGGAGAGGSAGSGAGMGGSAGTGSGMTHWVGTWTASPYYDSGNQPPSSLSNAVLRQVVHVSLGGSQLRFQFSNLHGNGAVTLNSVHIALCKATPAVDSTIDTATDKALAFSGMPNVTIAQGKEVWSDPIDFTVPALGNITITTAFGSVPSQVEGHSGSRTTSYLQTGSSNVTAANMSSATKFQHWYYISGIDVMADTSAFGIVAIGDSITDGRGTDDDHNNRWTDVLAARLPANVAMMNQGIGATNLVGNSGTAAQARFDRDVLGQSGVKYAIVLDGVNDIGGGANYNSLKGAYDDLIKRAHDKNVKIIGGTITPFYCTGSSSCNSYYSTAHEMVRTQVNTYVKSGAFDGYIDFDAAVSDGGNPPKLAPTYAAWAQEDGLHPGPAGYQKMGEAADLMLFK